MWFASAKPPYGTLDAAEWAPSTASKADICAAKVMSALPPRATAKAKFRKRPCPLYPRKQTCAVQLGMSALGQKRTSQLFIQSPRLRAAGARQGSRQRFNLFEL